MSNIGNICDSFHPEAHGKMKWLLLRNNFPVSRNSFFFYLAKSHYYSRLLLSLIRQQNYHSIPSTRHIFAESMLRRAYSTLVQVERWGLILKLRVYNLNNFLYVILLLLCIIYIAFLIHPFIYFDFHKFIQILMVLFISFIILNSTLAI